VVGYEILSNQGDYCASATIIITGLGFFASLLSMYIYGTPGYSHAHDWANTPILKWHHTLGEWVQILSYGKYSDYQLDDQYTYKWIAKAARMGFIQDDPPSTCYIICSEGMRKSVDEIIANTAKGTYN
jgi:hypothetical protein